MEQSIIFANEASFSSNNFSQELTQYAAGYNVPSVEKTLDFIAPPVKTSKRFEYAKFGKGAFIVDSDDARAVRGDFKIVEDNGEIISAKLVNRGLTEIIDNDDINDGYEQESVERLKKRLLRNDLVRAVAMVATAAGTATSKKWSATATGATNPETDLLDLKLSVGDSSGLNANAFLISSQAWSYRLAALMASDAPAEGVAAMFNPSQLAQFLGVNKLLVSEDKAEVNKEMKNIVTDKYVFAFNSDDNISKYDASTFKRFVGHNGFNVYVERKNKTTEVTVEHYSLLAQTGVGAVKALSISNT